MNNELLTLVHQIPGWLSKNEGKLLQKLAGDLPAKAVVVEIGSFQGKSTVYLGKGLRSGKIYAIDPHQGETHFGKKKLSPTYQSFLRNVKKFGIDKFVVPIHKTSKDANKNWRLSTDLLHIDGLHEYEFAKQDLRLWLPHLKNGGVVVCHDAFGVFPDVFQAIKEEIFDKNDYCYIAASDSQILAVKGKPKNRWQKVNVARQKFFLTLASEIWHNDSLPEKFRFFLVNRFLKIFFMNKFMFKVVLKSDL